LKTWQGFLAITGVSLAIAGGYLAWVFHERANPGVVGQPKPDAADALSKDDLVVMKEYFPQHFDDLKRLEGATVWMKNGYSMAFYPYAGGRVEFAKKVGLVPPLERLEIKKIVKAVAPVAANDGIEPGGMQAFAVFTLAGGKEMYATPIGVMPGGEEGYYTDMLFFYDDPHTIYDYWPKDVWTAIEAHQVKPGMSELETRLAIGQKVHVDGSREGDRTVTYDVNGKKWDVTYVKNRATEIKASDDKGE
jgi:hypothetical protein